MRRRPAAAAPAASSSAGGGGEDEGDEEEPEGYYVAKGSGKKHAKKQEKEARRQAEIAAREAKSEKQNSYDAIRRKKDEEREEEDRLKEEAAREQKAMEEEAANAELDKWKSAFVVDTEGTMEKDVQEESQGLLLDFVEYIKVGRTAGMVALTMDEAIPFNPQAIEIKNAGNVLPLSIATRSRQSFPHFLQTYALWPHTSTSSYEARSLQQQ